MRYVIIRLYEKVIAKFKSNEGWSRDIKCNIRVKKGLPLSPTLFGIYIDKLEGCLEEAGCVGTFLAGIVIILLPPFFYMLMILFFWQGDYLILIRN